MNLAKEQIPETELPMITRQGNDFILNTKSISYVFGVTETGHLEHLYSGRKIDVSKGVDALREKHAFPPGNANMYDDEHTYFTLEDICLEMSSYGKGDIREPFIELSHEDGSTTADFLFKDAVIKDEALTLEHMPSAYDDSGKAQTLYVTLFDKEYDNELVLSYTVYEECDCITRSARFVNRSNESVRLNRLLSMQLDLPDNDWYLTTFTGGWAREMAKNEQRIISGRYVNESFTGTTSSRGNSFFMVSRAGTDEDKGNVYGFHLVYSGNHYEACQVSSFNKLRIVSGINPANFSFVIGPGEEFEAPEAVLSFSHEGFNGLSNHFHDFINDHIVRGKWKRKARPILLNSWEAAYFDINESKLLKLAKAGKDAGIELFVMDDGWFGERNDDTSSLGDWDPNPKKLPSGIAGLCKKINDLGLEFGIWVEPEMVNVKSRLYEAHPDWALQIPGKPHSEGRNQRILDLTRKEVQDFIIDKMTEVFSSAPIAYVKWDMNRTMSDIFSPALPAERQGEVAHRYVLGLYRCIKTLTERFPDILFEGCSAGGNRFDPGILCYFPQIWASDDTDAVARAEMQNNYTYGYPLSVIGAHVSAVPNHQTLRITPLETRFSVACFGALGYECNFCDLPSEEIKAIEAQIELYMQWREVFQNGYFYRGRSFSGSVAGVNRIRESVISPDDGNLTEWTVVSRDKKRAVGMFMQKLVRPNTQAHIYFPKGLDEEKIYRFTNRILKYDVREFGDLVNTVSPIHIKQNSAIHRVIAHFVKMDGETEDVVAFGDALMYGGVKLKQAFSGTGYNGEVRFFPDFGARLYFMEEES